MDGGAGVQASAGERLLGQPGVGGVFGDAGQVGLGQRGCGRVPDAGRVVVPAPGPAAYSRSMVAGGFELTS